MTHASGWPVRSTLKLIGLPALRVQSLKRFVTAKGSTRQTFHRASFLAKASRILHRLAVNRLKSGETENMTIPVMFLRLGFY
jgi:hypothetical protein